MALPNLIVIGAAKCGTTALHEYLDLHPEISMSSVKETYFFNESVNWRRGVAWYESLFDASAPVRGESCPGYARFPHFPGVPARMKALLPDARLVYLVRDPIDRIHAAWAHKHADGDEPRALLEAVQPFAESPYVQFSRYWFQLEQHLEHFAPERVLVVPQDDLRHRTVPTLRRIFRFVGVDETFVSPEFDRLRNVSVEKRQKTRLGLALDRVARRFADERWAMEAMARAPAALKRPFTREFERQTLPETVRAELAAYLRPDVDRLRAHTGLALESWSV